MRLIDGDALGRYLNDWRYSISLKVKYARECAVLSEVMEAVDHAPTVDAVQVVRCNDGGHYHIADRRHPDTDWGKRLICGTIKPDFFCADGERESK